MNACRAGVFTLASIIVSFAFATLAHADVRPLTAVQTLARPATPAFTTWGQDVAIDGGHLIVLGAYAGGQQALLYRRSNSNGQWTFRRALVTWTGPFVRAEVAMRNGIAAIQFGDEVSIFELSGGDYVRGTSAAPIRHHGGLAISTNQVLIGGNNCDYDAVIYQKNTAGSWVITGRIDDNRGECFTTSETYAVELNYDRAILHEGDANAGWVWRRNGTALTWVNGGALQYPADEVVSEDAAFALQGNTAVAPNGAVWRRADVNGWIRQRDIWSVDRDDSAGVTFNVVYRDGVLVTNQSGKYRVFPRVYIESSPGQFEHVASMPFFDATGSNIADVSGRTVIVRAHDWDGSRQEVRVFTLPSPLRAPMPAVNDFEDRNISDLTFSGGQFALATRGSDDVLAQNSSSGLAVALMNDTDWTDHQRVEADITPTIGTGGWVGLVARYVDADNYYYLAIRADDTYGIYKRVNGVVTSLFEGRFYNTRTPTYRATLRVIRNRIDVHFSFQQGETVTDSSLSHGRGGVATWLSRADFDDVHVAATEVYSLFSRDWGSTGSDYFSGMEEWSGTWSVAEGGDEENSFPNGLSQSDTTRSAIAMVGRPVANQELNALMQLDSFGSSQQGAWFGLFARYVDAGNHYYVTVRSSGQIQIRKIVNGVVTVLGSANLTPAPVPGQAYDVRFLVINDQLQLFVDEVLVATAHDQDLTSGRYGIGTYRAAATWYSFWVVQP